MCLIRKKEDVQPCRQGLPCCATACCVDNSCAPRESCFSPFHIGGQIGRGANAAVFEACLPSVEAGTVSDLNRNCQYAAKVLRGDQAIEEMSITLYLKDSGAIPKLFDVFRCQDEIVLVMDRFDGTLIDYVLHRYPIEILKKKLGDLLASLHGYSVVHQDLHPGNIVYRKKGRHFQFALIDLGEAKRNATKKDIALEKAALSTLLTDDIPLILHAQRSNRDNPLGPDNFLDSAQPAVPVFPFWLKQTFSKEYNPRHVQ
jgi:tRNA A-37 threonylcarbamoyl transferase component Bud32